MSQCCRYHVVFRSSLQPDSWQNDNRGVPKNLRPSASSGYSLALLCKNPDKMFLSLSYILRNCRDF